MEGIIGFWLVFFVFVVAPVVAIETYILVWMCGPAIRMVTRRVAEGWFKVVDQRERGLPTHTEWRVEKGGRGERSSVPEVSTLLPKSPAPEPAKRAPAGPPRYLVPTEKE